MYVNRGVGHLLQVRFNVRPEVTMFRLETESSADTSSRQAATDAVDIDTCGVTIER
ncbi:MAG: hypothetical protein WD669_06295 [Pirellulales bacterium]